MGAAAVTSARLKAPKRGRPASASSSRGGASSLPGAGAAAGGGLLEGAIFVRWSTRAKSPSVGAAMGAGASGAGAARGGASLHKARAASAGGAVPRVGPLQRGGRVTVEPLAPSASSPTPVVDAGADTVDVVDAGDASPPLPTSYQVTIDLDFFSVRNPALRSLPWTSIPRFRLDLIALAKRVPMERGDAFSAALQSLVAGEGTPHSVLPAIAHAVGLCSHTSPEAQSLLPLLASIEVRFQDLSDLPHMRAALSSLLLANLAEHEATNEELNALERGLGALLSRVIAATPGGSARVPPVLIARSELYTPRRQVANVCARARRAVEGAT